MKFEWLGQACFLITLSGGKTIMTDPFDETLGYPLPKITPDIAVISHQHFDHNAVDKLPARPEKVVEGEGEQNVNGIKFIGIPSCHDPNGGADRGKNTIFVIEAEGLKICHLGDLGHDLEENQLNKLKDINVLMVPIGGHFTIDSDQAKKIIEQLKPNYVLPMHYKTEYIKLPIETPDKFLNYYPEYSRTEELEITPNNLPHPSQVVQLTLKSSRVTP